MNLGQAVAVCLYELASRAFLPARQADVRAVSEEPPDFAAPSVDLERLAELVDEVMQATDYSPASMQNANRHDLRLLLRRLAPTKRDTRRILGLFRKILWRLSRVPKQD
jgi:tRNA/rRNA methyltransferase